MYISSILLYPSGQSQIVWRGRILFVFLKFFHGNAKPPNVLIATSQVGFAELKKTADDRANIGGIIIGAPIVGQQGAQYILTDHQDADSSPMIRLILLRQL